MVKHRDWTGLSQRSLGDSRWREAQSSLEPALPVASLRDEPSLASVPLNLGGVWFACRPFL